MCGKNKDGNVKLTGTEIFNDNVGRFYMLIDTL